MFDSSSSDELLVEAMKTGDRAAFNVLFDRYWQTLYTTVFPVSRDAEACADVVHDVFLNLWLKREHLQIAYFKGYIIASARYQVYRHLKKSKRTLLEYREDPEDLRLVSMNDGDANIQYQELQRQVEGHINVLPKRCREIFTLSRMDQLSNDEIAERLDISKRTVENQLTHALHHLRVSMKDISILLAVILFF